MSDIEVSNVTSGPPVLLQVIDGSSHSADVLLSLGHGQSGGGEGISHWNREQSMLTSSPLCSTAQHPVAEDDILATLWGLVLSEKVSPLFCIY